MAKRRVAIIGLLLCLCLCLLPCGVQAASTSDAGELIDPDRDCTLTILYSFAQNGLEHISVELYHVANASAEMQYHLTEMFSASGLVLNGIRTAGEWDVIRTSLESFVLANAINADLVATTDAEGLVHFASLTPGLYLAIPKSTAEELPCSFHPALIALPGLNGDGNWQYDISVAAKYTIPTEPEDEIPFRVLKLWKDGDDPTKRPVSIEVEIFRDGKAVEKVLLSEKNNWSYSWMAAADGADWMVVERNVPEGYTVTVEDRTTSFILTNRLSPDETPDDPPKTGDTPRILFYVVLMCISGAILIFLGLTGKKNRYEDERS